MIKKKNYLKSCDHNPWQEENPHSLDCADQEQDVTQGRDGQADKEVDEEGGRFGACAREGRIQDEIAQFWIRIKYKVGSRTKGNIQFSP